MAHAREAAPHLVTEAVGSDEGICALYIDAWIGVAKVTSVLVDGGSLIDLIGAGVVRDLGLAQFEGAPLNILLANDLTIAVSTYVWLRVNVVEVHQQKYFYVRTHAPSVRAGISAVCVPCILTHGTATTSA